MVGNPYLIEGPALISVSGGRTSMSMLKKIIEAHGGTLPDDLFVCFANTGRENEKTLRFLHECSIRWNVHIVWLEWRCRKKKTPVSERFEIVNYNSASRAGEPFEALIRSKGAAPNVVQRWCTEHLKVQVCADFMASKGYTTWTNVIGLRADELRRAVRKDMQNEAGKDPWVNVMPMVKAGHTKEDVRRFWFGSMKPIDAVAVQRDFGPDAAAVLPQGFDLGLDEWEGNCTLCFMVGHDVLLHRIRRMPGEAAWWSYMERLAKGTFTTEYSYADLERAASSSPLLDLGDNFNSDAECGVGGADIKIRCGSRRGAAPSQHHIGQSK